MNASSFERCAQLLGAVANDYANQTTYLKHPRATPAVIFSIVTDMIYLSITFDSPVHYNPEYPQIQSELQGLSNYFNKHFKDFNSTTLECEPRLKFIIAESLSIKAPEWKTILQARFQLMLVNEGATLAASLFSDSRL